MSERTLCVFSLLPRPFRGFSPLAPQNVLTITLWLYFHYRPVRSELVRASMWRGWRRCRALASASSIVVGGCTLAACASDAMHTRLIPPPTTDPKETAAASAALPSNYRVLVAEYIRTHNRYVIRDAKITPPYERYGGLFQGGTMPAVCVAIYRDNPLGILVRDNRVFTYQNGQLREILLGTEPCSDLSAFTELKGS